MHPKNNLFFEIFPLRLKSREENNDQEIKTNHKPCVQSGPFHPASQLHVNEPSLLLQVAPFAQSPTPSLAKHSFVSEQITSRIILPYTCHL